jgi:hypothetical protein
MGVIIECAESRLVGLIRAAYRENRAAHSLMPPLRLMNLSRGSESGLYMPAYRITRDHLLRVRLSALAGSAVQRMTAAKL